MTRTTDLAEEQAQVVAVLQQGPSHFPHGLFAGDSDRALLGLKAHANTISHARLVALEQTYPRTLAAIGLERFNALSRAFIDQPHVRQRKLMGLGQGFASYLANHAKDVVAANLAAVEWTWLESYHAAEAGAMQLADLAGLDEAGLLDLAVITHPAMRLVPLHVDLAQVLAELDLAAAPDATAILVTRPDADVQLLPLGPCAAMLAGEAQKGGTMRNLLACAIETTGEAEALPALFALIQAGALASPAS